MPEKNKAVLDEKMDDIVVEHDFGMSRGDKEFVPEDQTPENELVEGLEDLEKVAGSREIQKRKRQL